MHGRDIACAAVVDVEVFEGARKRFDVAHSGAASDRLGRLEGSFNMKWDDE